MATLILLATVVGHLASADAVVQAMEMSQLR